MDIDKLIHLHNIKGNCDDNSAKEVGLEWELISVTSTFNISKMPPIKLPSFKNMGCFNHYKNKNQVLIFGGLI